MLYKIPAHPTLAWPKQTVQSGHSAEGTAIADLNGDGKNEIVWARIGIQCPRAAPSPANRGPNTRWRQTIVRCAARPSLTSMAMATPM